jgi:hypothetical protein
MEILETTFLSKKEVSSKFRNYSYHRRKLPDILGKYQLHRNTFIKIARKFQKFLSIDLLISKKFP